MEQMTLNVQGMTCGHCVRSVESALTAIDGVKAVKVDLKGARATVDFEPAHASAKTMITALEEAGYEASVG